MADFFREIKKKIERMRERREESLWHTLTYVGSVSVVLLFPVVLGAYLGWLLDGQYRAGKISWTITFILLGLMVGIYNVYIIFYRKEIKR